MSKSPALAFMFLLVSAIFAGAQSDHALTLKEVLQSARDHNPNLKSQAMLLAATRAEEITAGLRPNPELSIAKEDFGASQFSPSDQTINVSQLFERGHKRRYRVESARLTSTLAQHAYADVERQLMLSVKQSFVSLLLAKANAALAEDNRRDYARTVELSRTRFSAGEISRTDLDRIEIQASRFENDALTANQAIVQAKTQLQSLMGIADFKADFDIAGDLAPPEHWFDPDKLRQAALAARPDYLAALDQIRKSESDVRLAQANGATDFTAGAEYKRSGPDNFAGLTLGIPLRIFDRNQGEKLKSRRVLDASRSTETAARIQVLSDVNQALAAHDTAVRLARLYSADYLERARQVRDRVEFSYRNGATSLLDYIDALREYRETELAWHAAEAQVLNAIHQLSFVINTELLQ